MFLWFCIVLCISEHSFKEAIHNQKYVSSYFIVINVYVKFVLTQTTTVIKLRIATDLFLLQIRN